MKNMLKKKEIEVISLFGELSLDESLKWYVAYTKPQREKKLAKYAFENRINYFLPLYDSVKKYLYRKVVFIKPLFPGYVFFHCKPEDKTTLIKSGHIVSFLKSEREDILLFDLIQIYQSSASGVEMTPHPYLEKGISVELIDGPLKGMKGIVENANDLNKVILQVSMLQRAVSVQTEARFVKIIKMQEEEE